MMDFKIKEDIEIVKELTGLNFSDLSSRIGVSEQTILNWCDEKTDISYENVEKFYNFTFCENIRLNVIREHLLIEENKSPEKIILFHGAKTDISGEISIEKSRAANDFGKGFYCGQSLEQSAMFVSGYSDSSLYMIEFDTANLTHTDFFVDRDWMLTIAYFRGKLNEYENHPIIKTLRERVNSSDYIIAPIADNRMFEIIDSFIAGEITDVQCRHCLSATNLGNQYVFKTYKAVKNLKIVYHCYLCDKEKQYYMKSKIEESKIGNDKVKIARKQFRGQGQYIEEILQ